ncbi:hypothetical protein HHI36_013343 [Cryptolaemus montrouzieri]|uniref:Uncharacterized protein n=1 Tax=Cryptolaemus montrouzieri TaxID=559131 RepID=A0ABD2NGU1_9CUCU
MSSSSESEKSDCLQLEKRSWIYKQTKVEIQRILDELNIPYNEADNIDSLRKLLSNYCKEKLVKQNTLPSDLPTLEVSQGPSVNLTLQAKQVRTMAYGYDIKQFDGEGWEVFEQQLDCAADPFLKRTIFLQFEQ